MSTSTKLQFAKTFIETQQILLQRILGETQLKKSIATDLEFAVGLLIVVDAIENETAATVIVNSACRFIANSMAVITVGDGTYTKLQKIHVALKLAIKFN